MLLFQNHGKGAHVMPWERIPTEAILGARTSALQLHREGAVDKRAHDYGLKREPTAYAKRADLTVVAAVVPAIKAWLSHTMMAVLQPFWRLQGSLKTCHLHKSGATKLGLRLVGLHQLAGGLSDSQHQCRLQGVLRSSLELPSLVEAKRR